MKQGGEPPAEPGAPPVEGLQLLASHRRGKVEIVRQSEAAECGLCCLAMIAGAFGYKADIASLRRRFPISLKGTSLKNLIEIGDELKLASRPLSADLDELEHVRLPAMLHWNLNHFAVLTAVKRRLNGCAYLIADPARGPRVLSRSELSRYYTGVAIEFSPAEKFERKSEAVKLQITQLWSRTRGLWQALLNILLLSFLLQLFAFASPFYMQLAIDVAVPAFDKGILTMLAAGFLGLSIINLTVSTVRELVLLKVSNTLNYQVVSNLFRHLVSLPMSYFEKRHIGDVISRFDSTQPISDALSKGLISAVIDGFMAVALLAFMFFYSVFLTCTCLFLLSAYVLMRVVCFRAQQMANVSLISARASEASTIIETIRGMGALKLFVREGDRHRLWQRKRATVVNAATKVGQLQIWFDLGSNIVLAIDHLLFVYITIGMVIDGHLTVGMIFAFHAYKQQFISSITRLVTQVIQFKVLDVHLARIADIALSPAEQQSMDRLTSELVLTHGAIEVRDVHFSYGWGEADVLKSLSFQIAAGETLAIIGPSGGGKTTLLKLLVGLNAPTRGSILVDGVSIDRIGLQTYRSRIGTVMQDDTLYAGSLAENISFFDHDVDMAWVIKCAKAACIHDDIMTMPMRYETFVGDMGSSLSGGQKQRLLLARALYPRPLILFMDEGTAHLDVRTEAAVNESIKSLGITRVVVAHRPETIRAADRAITLVGGRIVEPVESKLAIPV